MKRFLLAALALLWVSAAVAQPAAGTGYPAGSTPFVAVATAAGTSATLTVTAVTGQRTFICAVSAFENAGTGQTTVGSLTNLQGPALTAVTYSFWFSGLTFSATAAGSYSETFSPCLPVVPGQNVVATSPIATAATASAINVAGYFLPSP